MSTFGKITVGATGTSGQEMGRAGVYTCRFTAPESGTITEIVAYLYWGALPLNVIPVVYDDLEGKPNNLLATGVPIEQTVYGWVALPINLGIVTGKVYHLGILTPTSMWGAADLGETAQTNFDGMDVYPNPNNPFGPPRTSYDRELSIYATYIPSERGILEVHAYEDSAEVEASIEVVGIGTYLTPFNIDLGMGSYVLNATYGSHPTQTKTEEILDGETTMVSFNFVVTKHILTVVSTPIEGVPFTIEKVI